jgi:creatinine amidohydrolase
MDWQLLSTHEHAEGDFASVLLPVGTIEAHDGGPIGTDNLIPEALCRRLSQRLKMPTLPVMPYGVTHSLLAYPGSLSLTAATLESVLFELGCSLKRSGIGHLFVINGHGGNTEALRAAAGRLFREANLYTAVIDWWLDTQHHARELFGEGGMGHSAIDEMGALLGFCPELRQGMPREPVPSFYNYRGLRALPAPRAVMTYDHPDDPVDFSRLTPEKCATFAERVTETLVTMINEIVAGWKEIGR